MSFYLLTKLASSSLCLMRVYSFVAIIVIWELLN